MVDNINTESEEISNLKNQIFSLNMTIQKKEYELNLYKDIYYKQTKLVVHLTTLLRNKK